MITKILRLIESLPAVTRNSTQWLIAKAASTPLALRLKNLMLKTCAIHTQNESPNHFAWQSEFLFIQEKSKLTISTQGDVRLPNRAFSSVGYHTITSSPRERNPNVIYD